MPHVRVRDRSVHYTDEGRGVPIVFVHSSGMSSRQWTRLASRFAVMRRVIAPDLLGSGQSDPVPDGEPFHFHDDVAALDAVLATLGEPVHLVGHSYGGLVALTSARNDPGRVRSLSLFEPVAFGVLRSAGEHEAIADLESNSRDGFFDEATGGSEPWMQRFVDWWQGQGVWRALPEATRASFLAVGRKVFAEVRSLLLDRTPHDAYRALAMPALFMMGERSPMPARRVCEVLARTLPDASLVTVEGAGHMAPLTHGPIVGDLLAEHFRKAESKTSA